MKCFLDVSKRRGSVSSSLRVVGNAAINVVSNPSSSSMRTSVLKSAFSTAPLRDETPTAIPIHHDTSTMKETMKPKQQFDYSDPLLLSTLLTEDERLVSDTAKSFCQDNLLPTILEANRNENFDPNLMKEMGNLGFLGSKFI